MASVDLVISAYQDSLDWIGPLRQPGMRVFVYDKWDGERHPERYVQLFVERNRPHPAFFYNRLPNCGMLDHTFAHHIATHYDDLADWTVFTPDGPHDHLPEGVSMEGVMVPREHLAVPRLWRGRDWGPDGRLNWKHWGNNPKRGGTSWKEHYESGKVTPAKLSFVEWAKRYVGYDVNGPDWPGYCPGSIFGVPRRAITYLPVAFYARLREQLSHAREPEEGHYAERLWPAIFSGKARYIPEEAMT